MKKKPFVIILAIIMIIISLVFAACNGNPTDTTLPAPPSDLEPKPEPDPEPEPLPDPPPEEVYESEGIEFYSMFEYDEVLGDYEKVVYSVASVTRLVEITYTMNFITIWKYLTSMADCPL